MGLGNLNEGKNPPFPCAVISQPTLNCLSKRTPDFFGIAANRTQISPVFIEIETPHKRWFTKAGIQTSMNFLDYKQSANFLTLFLPFIFERPLLIWGLPIKEYRPKRLIQHAFSILQNPGIWLITNQGEQEYRAQHELLYDLKIPFHGLGEFTSSFYQYPIPHFVTVIIKK